MSTAVILGWLATFFFNVSYVPQIWKTYKTKKVEDISLGLWIALVLAYICGITYSLSIKAWPIVVGHIVGFSCVTVYLLMYFKYRGKEHVQNN